MKYLPTVKNLKNPCPFCNSPAFVFEYKYWPDCAKKPSIYYGSGCTTDDCRCEVDSETCFLDTIEEAEQMLIENIPTSIEEFQTY